MLTVRGNGDIRVAVNGSRWVFNPKCLTPAPGEMPIEERTGESYVSYTHTHVYTVHVDVVL